MEPICGTHISYVNVRDQGLNTLVLICQPIGHIKIFKPNQIRLLLKDECILLSLYRNVCTICSVFMTGLCSLVGDDCCKNSAFRFKQHPANAGVRAPPIPL